MFSNSQEINSLEFVVEDNDTIYLSELPEIEIFEFNSIDDRVKIINLKKSIQNLSLYSNCKKEIKRN